MAVPVTIPFAFSNGTIADATQVNANFNGVVTAFAAAAAAGANSDITSLLGLTTPIPYTAGGSSVYIGANGAGTANAQTVASAVPGGYSLVKGKLLIFIAGATNTGATTLDANSTGATNVFKTTPAGVVALTGGEIVSGNPIAVWFDGTRHVLLNDASVLAGALTTLSSAAPDLGTIPSHNVSITGTTTITSFGSTASTAFPTYFLTFAGILTLTYDGTALIIPGARSITTAAGDTAIAMYLGSGNWKVLSYNPLSPRTAPNIQPFLSGTAATYTTPTGNQGQLPLYLHVRMAGPGGGGGARATNAGAAGSAATSFASWTAAAGAGGAAAAGASGAGGTGGTNSTGTLITRITGQAGQSGIGAGFGASASGGIGGSNMFAGGGTGAGVGATGADGVTNTGGGGQGGGGASTATGSGGGAGEYVEFIITSPAASYTYTVGAGGAGGAAGTTAGGAGAAGRIDVIAYF